MTRKPKSPIARWRGLPAKVRARIIERTGESVICWDCARKGRSEDELCKECGIERDQALIAAAVLKHAARKRKVK